jgi:addiction module RelE/StbE family toxin
VKVHWTEPAERQRAEILAYIAANNRSAARRMHGIFKAAASRLGQHPQFGTPSKIPNTREYVVHPNYRMVYRVSEDTIWIVTVIHTAREWPPAQD